MEINSKPMNTSQALLSPILDVDAKMLLILGINRQATLVRRQIQRHGKNGENSKEMNEIYLLFETCRNSLGKLAWMTAKDHVKNYRWETPKWKILHDNADATKRFLVRVMNIINP